ncbi:hypothetical protein RSAG8_07113, partial [Rhizoctonia solani AG-8 WAC10335]
MSRQNAVLQEDDTALETTHNYHVACRGEGLAPTVVPSWALAPVLSYDGNFRLIKKKERRGGPEEDLNESPLHCDCHSDNPGRSDNNHDTLNHRATEEKAELCKNHPTAKETWNQQTGLAETMLGSFTSTQNTSNIPRVCTLNHRATEEKAELCKNHPTAKETWNQQTGLAETMLGSFTSTQNTSNIPRVCVNHYKGERYAYADYAMSSLNDKSSVGRYDAEGGERVWADLNCAVGSTWERRRVLWIDNLKLRSNGSSWRRTNLMIETLRK